MHEFTNLQSVTSTATGLVCLTTPLFVAAGYWLKRYSQDGETLTIAIAFTLYGLANLGYSKLMGLSGLSSALLTSTISTTALTMIVSVVAFHEHWTLNKTVAVVALFVAAIALSFPALARA